MKRHEFINALIQARGFKSYLEIGVDDPNSTFNHIRAEKKVGVDPYDDTTGCHVWTESNRQALIDAIDESAEFHQTTSDAFFENLHGNTKFDLIFIDGLHYKEQVEKDFNNAVKHLKKAAGVILIDDVCPNNQQECKIPPTPGQGWRGNVWEFWAEKRGQDQDQLFVVAKELGLGVVDFSVKQNGTFKFHTPKWPTYTLSYQFYEVYRTALMNEKPLKEVLRLLKI